MASTREDGERRTAAWPSMALAVLIVVILFVSSQPAEGLFADEIGEPTPGRKAVLLFDVEHFGPDAKMEMDAILDVFEEKEIKGVFNFVGEYAQHHPDVVERTASLGHDIGMHSMHHWNLSEMGIDGMRKELIENIDVLEDIIGYKPFIFRAPFLETPDNYTALLGELGVFIDMTGWNTKDAPVRENGVLVYASHTDDWLTLIRDKTSNRGFVNQVQREAKVAIADDSPLVIGFHPQMIYPNLTAMVDIIDLIKEMGFEIVSVTDLHNIRSPTPIFTVRQSETKNYIVVPSLYFEVLQGLILIMFLAIAFATYFKAKRDNPEKLGVTFSFIFLFLLVLLYKYFLFNIPDPDPMMLFFIYSLLVTTYILSRFILAALYKKPKDNGITPGISVVIPAMNEEECIFRTVAAYFNTTYPKDKMEIILIDDGSSDGTWSEMQRVIRYKRSRRDLDDLRIVSMRFPKNRGKRRGMAVGIRVAQNEIIVMNDSDSYVEPDALYKLVQPFADPKVAGVAGHTDVENRNNVISKMQVVRYYVAFKVYKSAEALFDSVICLSGCFSAYKKSALLEVLPEWEKQSFLGVPCTYGDDRGLTTYLLGAGYKTTYHPDAKATTVVPEKLRQLWKQQLRWKKSWIRETYLVAPIVKKRHPVFAASFFISTFLTFAGFLVALRAMLYVPVMYGTIPVHYIGGLAVISVLYVAYYRMYHRDGMGIYSLVWIIFYLLVLSWQIFLAATSLKDNNWGTRGEVGEKRSLFRMRRRTEDKAPGPVAGAENA